MLDAVGDVFDDWRYGVWRVGWHCTRAVIGPSESRLLTTREARRDPAILARRSFFGHRSHNTVRPGSGARGLIVHPLSTPTLLHSHTDTGGVPGREGRDTYIFGKYLYSWLINAKAKYGIDFPHLLKWLKIDNIINVLEFKRVLKTTFIYY